MERLLTNPFGGHVADGIRKVTMYKDRVPERHWQVRLILRAGAGALARIRQIRLSLRPTELETARERVRCEGQRSEEESVPRSRRTDPAARLRRRQYQCRCEPAVNAPGVPEVRFSGALPRASFRVVFFTSSTRRSCEGLRLGKE